MALKVKHYCISFLSDDEHYFVKSRGKYVSTTVIISLKTFTNYQKDLQMPLQVQDLAHVLA